MTRSINEVDRMHTYFYLKLKYPVFFYLFSFFFHKIREQEGAEQALPRGEGWH
jgi:hypothetical protein